MDVVFCRNVIIYFDRPTQQRLFSRICDVMRDDGVLMIGHSETLHGICDRFEPLRGTVYVKRGGAGGTEPARERATAAPAAAPAPAAARPATGAPVRSAAAASRVRPPRLSPVAAAGAAASAADDDAPEHRIEVGGIFASREPAIVSTLLGSCVAACLFDPVVQVGGMNHFLLPDSSDDRGFPTRYGVNAMEVLINEIMKLGGDRRRLVAKVFGAGHVLAGSGMGATVPDRNAAFVKEFLRRENIPIKAERLGGNSATVVKFHTHSGRARIRTREVVADGTLAAREQRFIQQIAKDGSAPHPGDVSLF
jgi:chemotaxis receptor (MCP) glutamine deamidase CheD